MFGIPCSLGPGRGRQTASGSSSRKTRNCSGVLCWALTRWWNAAMRGFFRGVAIAIAILALLYVVAQLGHH